MTAHVEADELKDRILLTAVRLFMDRGYNATTMQDIIDTVGCSKGAFYHHFQSKDDLLLIIHEGVMEDALTRIQSVLEMPGTATERLRRFIREVIFNVVSNRAQLTVFLEEHRFMERKAFASVLRKRRAFEGLVVKLIEEGIAAGELRADLDATVVMKGLFGVTNWTYRWLDEAGPLPVERVADMLASMVIDGLALQAPARDGARKATSKGRARHSPRARRP